MSRLELKACQAHVAPAVLPAYTTAALHFAALMSAYCLRPMIGSNTYAASQYSAVTDFRTTPPRTCT